MALLPPARAEPAEELVVEEAAPAGSRPEAIAANLSVVDLADQPASADLGEVLQTVPGAFVRRLGGLGDWSAVSLRGSSARQVLVCLDGVPLNPDGAETINLAELPIQAFDRVEVWRSQAPARYAAAPIGGVVDLHSRAGPFTAASATGGSYETGRAVLGLGREARTPAGELSGLGLVDLFRTAGDFRYFDDHGTPYTPIDDRFATRGNNDKQQGSGLLRLRLARGRGHIGVQEGFLLREEGLPGHTQAPSAEARLGTLRSLLSLQAERAGPGGRLEARSWWLRRQEALSDPGAELGLGAQEQTDGFDTLGLLIHGAHAPDPRLLWSLTAQVRGEQYIRRDRQTGETDPARSRLFLGLAAQADLRDRAERLLLSPALQAQELLDQDPSADARGRLALNPRLGLAFRPRPGFALKANLARGLRVPDLSELYGDRGSMKGNPELLPERATSGDLGLRASGRADEAVRGSLELAAFWVEARDAILVVQNSQRTSIPVNFGRTRSRGLEAAAGLDLAERIDLGLALTATDARNQSDDPSLFGKRLPGIPVLQASLQAGLRQGERWRLGYDLSWTEGTFQDATNFYRLAPRRLHALHGRVQPGRRWPAAELSVLNLTDHLAEVVPRNPLDRQDDARILSAVTDFAGYPLPGRTILFSLRFEPR